MRTAVVLGGGGVLGVAYHAGVLAALHHDLGWDARDADVVVGTSAGSLVGALLRLGAAPTDLAAVTVGGEPWDTPAALVDQLRRRPAAPLEAKPTPSSWAPPLLDPALVMRWVVDPWSFDPLDALVNLVPDGRIDLVAELDLPGGPFDVGWPDAELLVCSARRRDCVPTVFDRASGAPLALTLAASCAIPGHFAPVRIDGVSYIDGGVRSSTNAATLVGRHVDLAVIVAPMAGRAPGLVGAEAATRRHIRSRVQAERLALSRAGIRSVVFEPGVEVIRCMGLAFMDDERAADVAREAFLDAGRQLTDPAVAHLLQPLAAGHRARARARAA